MATTQNSDEEDKLLGEALMARFSELQKLASALHAGPAKPAQPQRVIPAKPARPAQPARVVPAQPAKPATPVRSAKLVRAQNRETGVVFIDSAKGLSQSTGVAQSQIYAALRGNKQNEQWLFEPFDRSNSRHYRQVPHISQINENSSEWDRIFASMTNF